MELLEYVYKGSLLGFSDKDELIILRMLIFFLVIGLIVLWYKYNWEKYSIKEEEEEEILQDFKLVMIESIEALMNLARINSPSFWVYFQEIFPMFCNKILYVNSGMKSSELIFCAYIYLGFSTKEIAYYTCKALKTVENNRYNLRKKFNLSPDEDLMLWLRMVVGSEKNRMSY